MKANALFTLLALNFLSLNAFAQTGGEGPGNSTLLPKVECSVKYLRVTENKKGAIQAVDIVDSISGFGATSKVTVQVGKDISYGEGWDLSETNKGKTTFYIDATKEPVTASLTVIINGEKYVIPELSFESTKGETVTSGFMLIDDSNGYTSFGSNISPKTPGHNKNLQTFKAATVTCLPR